MSGNDALFEIRALSVTPQKHTPALVTGFSLTLERGHLYALAGPNGSGKTTLLSTLAGFSRPAAGSVRIDGKDLHAISPQERARRIAVVLTDRPDSAFLSVSELVALGRIPFSRGRRLDAEDRNAVSHAIDRLGLARLAHRRVSSLSDGERQRTMIARAVAQSPDVLLLDEPTSHLDIAGEVEILAYLLGIAREERISVFASSHKLPLMISHCDSLSLIRRDRSVISGIPESVALAGEVSRAFDTELVRFDDHALRFRSCRRRDRWDRVSVTGEGTAALWTRRALERQGYIEAAEARIRVIVSENRRGPQWELSAEGRNINLTCESLDTLLDELAKLRSR